MSDALKSSGQITDCADSTGVEYRHTCLNECSRQEPSAETPQLRDERVPISAPFRRQAPITPTITRDPADDQVLACALAARADLVVSGDAQLLNLKRFHAIEIVAAAEAVRRIKV